MSVSAQQSRTPMDHACAKEPIHVPGAIQPHGYLATLDAQGRVAQVSANIDRWCGHAPDRLIGAPLADALGDKPAAMVADALPRLQEGETMVLGVVDANAPAAARDGDAAPRAPGGWFVVLHQYKGVRVVELEKAQHQGDLYNAMYPLVQDFLGGLQRDIEISELAVLAANQISKITGFGRTLVYRFDHEGHGHVIAEALRGDLPSFLAQRFPASDIPAQARQLYRLNRIRLIPDADYVPAVLVPALHPDTGAATDLTLASLRSVSPVHVQYMRNMGTAASMSMSIVVGNTLWGLISCHHDAPRIAPFETRTACAHIAQILSLQIEARDLQFEAAYRLSLRKILSALLAQMAKTDSFVDALVADKDDLLAFTASTGAAIVFEGRITRIGETPADRDIEKLVDWLVEQPDDIVHTDRARDVCAWMADGPIAGVLAVSLSKVFRNYVIWFRPEVIQTVEWAGDPRAKLATLSDTLSPRESFETWTDTVRDRSMPWLAAEREMAFEFRTAMLGIVLTRAEELAQLAMALGQANRELEDFSYTVSHDLRAPLRHIHSFAALLEEVDGGNLSTRGQNFIKRILTSSEFGGRLVDDLLAFAQMGRAALDVHELSLRAIVDDVVAGEARLATESQRDAEHPREITWEIGDLPRVEGDATFLRLALQNLVSNAAKFSRKVAHPKIEIGTLPANEVPAQYAGQHVVYVRDNGAGFDMKYAGKLFGVFQRLHADDEFTGTGIGLAHVRRIMERHGGSVWAQGAPGKGATFFLSLPLHYRAQSGVRETPAAAVARLAATGELSPTGGVRKGGRHEARTKNSK
ncbi:ATP-binding protein [Robbsia sp. KACC 23696]|uniref:ATP-binding protein n=1 Tax=Robbsia sp. KACC 23696 TaxID=3149231 RepID=UPI00325B9C41